MIDTSVAVNYYGRPAAVTIATYELGGHSIDIVRHNAGAAIQRFLSALPLQ